jgi:hypothetical protein
MAGKYTVTGFYIPLDFEDTWKTFLDTLDKAPDFQNIINNKKNMGMKMSKNKITSLKIRYVIIKFLQNQLKAKKEEISNEPAKTQNS